MLAVIYPTNAILHISWIAVWATKLQFYSVLVLHSCCDLPPSSLPAVRVCIVSTAYAIPNILLWNATLCKCVWMWIYWFLCIHSPVFCRVQCQNTAHCLHILEFVEFVEFVELVGFVGLARVSRHPSLARAWLGVNLLCTTVQTYNTTFSLSSSSSSSPYSS